MGCGLRSGPTFKKALCRTCPVVGRRTKKIKGKMTEEHESDRVGKYAPYFQGNTILRILDLVAAMEPMTLFLIVADLRTRSLAGLKKNPSWGN